MFIVGILTPPLLGFSSVSYFTCNRTTYASIIEDRAYLVEVNLAQLQAALVYTTVAIFLWCLVVFVLILTGDGEPAA